MKFLRYSAFVLLLCTCATSSENPGLNKNPYLITYKEISAAPDGSALDVIQYCRPRLYEKFFGDSGINYENEPEMMDFSQGFAVYVNNELYGHAPAALKVLQADSIFEIHLLEAHEARNRLKNYNINSKAVAVILK